MCNPIYQNEIYNLQSPIKMKLKMYPIYPETGVHVRAALVKTWGAHSSIAIGAMVHILQLSLVHCCIMMITTIINVIVVIIIIIIINNIINNIIMIIIIIIILTIIIILIIIINIINSQPMEWAASCTRVRMRL
jgi:hypothetical protein